jgi:hypothetical protein
MEGIGQWNIDCVHPLIVKQISRSNMHAFNAIVSGKPLRPNWITTRHGIRDPSSNGV